MTPLEEAFPWCLQGVKEPYMPSPMASAALVEDPPQGFIELINNMESLHLNNKGSNQLVDESSIGMEDGDTNDEESLGGEMEIDTPKSVKMRKGNAIKTF